MVQSPVVEWFERMLDNVKYLCSEIFSAHWMLGILALDAILTVAIIVKVPFNHVDWVSAIGFSN